MSKVLHMMVCYSLFSQKFNLSPKSLWRVEEEAFGQMFACLFTSNPIDRVAEGWFPIGSKRCLDSNVCSQVCLSSADQGDQAKRENRVQWLQRNGERFFKVCKSMILHLFQRQWKTLIMTWGGPSLVGIVRSHWKLWRKMTRTKRFSLVSCIITFRPQPFSSSDFLSPGKTKGMSYKRCLKKEIKIGTWP